jgi:hypothetical protein
MRASVAAMGKEWPFSSLYNRNFFAFFAGICCCDTKRRDNAVLFIMAYII